MSEKFFPNSDTEAVTKAENFARGIAKDPARFEITQEDSDAFTAAAARFRAALQATKFGQRSEAATRAKNDARADVKVIMQRLGHHVRSNLRVDSASKMALGIHPRKEKPKQLPCPPEPPRLRFVRALHEGGGAVPVHELAFRAFDRSAAKPAGAVRLELFVDLIPPEEPIPAHPGANHGGRPWYLRSFTRGPIRLTPPMARVPMRVVYWGRWADSTGNVGPFSATAVAWIEGGTHRLLPGGAGMVRLTMGGGKTTPILEDADTSAAAGRGTTYVVAVLEAQHQSFIPQEIAPALPEPEMDELRQLEGPAEAAA